MRKGYIDVRVICPFYIYDPLSNEILCENYRGLFKNNEEKTKYKKTMCNTWCYRNCPIYKTLIEKYNQ